MVFFCYNLGKSGIVGQRLSASLVSIGCLSNYVHGAEWGHGDLGNINDTDIKTDNISCMQGGQDLERMWLYFSRIAVIPKSV